MGWAPGCESWRTSKATKTPGTQAALSGSSSARPVSGTRDNIMEETSAYKKDGGKSPNCSNQSPGHVKKMRLFR